MNRTFAIGIFSAIFGSWLLLACGTPTGQKVKQVVIKGGITNYCKASDIARQALREEFTTSKGPLVTVHCENLE